MIQWHRSAGPRDRTHGLFTRAPSDQDPDGAYLRLRAPLEAPRLQRLFALVARVEPALLSLTLPDRATRFRPLGDLEPELATLRTLDAWQARFQRRSPELSVDPHHLLASPEGALEVRLLDRAAAPSALRAWADLWARLVDASTRRLAPRGDRRPTLLCTGDSGDVVDLVRRLGGDVALARALAVRRAAVTPAWERAGPPWSDVHRRARAGWWSP
jgi:hypothetical protein